MAENPARLPFEQRTLTAYCAYLGWDNAELGRQAGLNPRTVANAIARQSIKKNTRLSIVRAFRLALNNPDLQSGDINW